MSDTVNEFAAQEGVEVAAAPESAPVEQEVVATEEGQQVEQAAEQVGNPEEQGSEPPKAVRELIEQRKKRQKAEQEAAYWRGMAEARGPQQAPQEQPQAAPASNQPPKAPVLDNFDTYEEYEQAKDEYVIAKAEYQITQKYLQQQRAAQQKQAQMSFEQRLNDAAKADPTILEIKNDPTLPVSELMAQMLQRMETAPQMLKWLNNNRDDAQRMMRMDPMSLAMEFGRVDTLIKSTPKPPAPKKVSAAPAPIQTVQATSSAEIDEDDLPMEEYYKRRTKQLLGR